MPTMKLVASVELLLILSLWVSTICSAPGFSGHQLDLPAREAATEVDIGNDESTTRNTASSTLYAISQGSAETHTDQSTSHLDGEAMGDDAKQDARDIDRSPAGSLNTQYTGTEPTMVPYSPKKTCELSVHHNSAKFFRQYVLQNSPDFLNITMVFPDKHTDLSHDSDLIEPFQWVWSPSFGVVDRLHWPYDFSIVSLNLLYSETEFPIKLLFVTEERDCVIHLGQHATTAAIAKALVNLTNSLVEPPVSLSQTYAYSLWCYKKETPNFDETLSYKAALYLGWFVQYGQYSCCETKYNWTTNNVSIKCADRVIKDRFETGMAPVIASLIIYAFLPLAIVLSETGVLSVSEDTEELFPAMDESTSGVVQKERNDADWVYLDGAAPITLSRMLLSMCEMENKHPHFVSRFRRVLFLFLSPVFVYTNVLLHVILEPEFTKELLLHRAPIGFLTILGPQLGSHLFVPFLCGPLGLLCIHHVLGLFFLVVPESLERVVSVEVNIAWQRSDDSWSPLFLPLGKIQELSSLRLAGQSRQVLLGRRLQAQFLMIWRPKFWGFLFKLQIDRFATPCMTCFNSRHGCILFVVTILILPLYLLLCCVEIVLCVLFYGTPVIGFTILASAALWRAMAQKCTFRSHLLDVCLAIVVLVTGFTFFFTCSIIATHSLYFVSRVFVYTYISVIVYPKVAFGYVFFSTAIAFYMFKILSRIGQEYNDLLVDVSDICIRLDSRSTQPKTTEDRHQVKSSRTKTLTSPVDDEQRLHLIHDVGLYSGVPRQLFGAIVKKHRPLYIQVFKALLRIVVIIFIMLATVVITNRNSASNNLSDVMHVVFIVVLGALPHVLDMPHFQSTRKVQRDIFLRDIERSVLAYMASATCRQE